MRIPDRRGFTLLTSTSRSSTTRRYHAELWIQPAHRWLISQLYHWYDMNITRLPGVRAVERVLNRRRLARSLDAYIPVDCERDIRCYHLRQRGRVTVAIVDIDEQTWEQVTGRRADGTTPV